MRRWPPEWFRCWRTSRLAAKAIELEATGRHTMSRCDVRHTLSDGRLVVRSYAGYDEFSCGELRRIRATTNAHGAVNRATHEGLWEHGTKIHPAMILTSTIGHEYQADA